MHGLRQTSGLGSVSSAFVQTMTTLLRSPLVLFRIFILLEAHARPHARTPHAPFCFCPLSHQTLHVPPSSPPRARECF